MEIGKFCDSVLRGMGQVMLQNNALTGLLFLLGILVSSWQMMLAALLGAASGTLAAILFKYGKKDIDDGLYGFNGALVGVALLFYFKPGLLMAALIIVGAALSTAIMNFMHRKNMSPYTFPFILTAWIIIALAGVSHAVPPQFQTHAFATSLNAVSALSMAFGQVMFQANILTGILFLAGIFVCSRVSALHAFIGSLVGMLLALAISFPFGLINAGIFGYNGVLCGVAFAKSKKYSYDFTILASAISVLVTFLMVNLGIPALTSPFVFSTWIMLSVQGKFAS